LVLDEGAEHWYLAHFGDGIPEGSEPLHDLRALTGFGTSAVRAPLLLKRKWSGSSLSPASAMAPMYMTALRDWLGANWTPCWQEASRTLNWLPAC
jgi:hypothetical protein